MSVLQAALLMLLQIGASFGEGALQQSAAGAHQRVLAKHKGHSRHASSSHRRLRASGVIDLPTTVYFPNITTPDPGSAINNLPGGVIDASFTELPSITSIPSTTTPSPSACNTRRAGQQVEVISTVTFPEPEVINQTLPGISDIPGLITGAVVADVPDPCKPPATDSSTNTSSGALAASLGNSSTNGNISATSTTKTSANAAPSLRASDRVIEIVLVARYVSVQSLNDLNSAPSKRFVKIYIEAIRIPFPDIIVSFKAIAVVKARALLEVPAADMEADAMVEEDPEVLRLQALGRRLMRALQADEDTAVVTAQAVLTLPSTVTNPDAATASLLVDMRAQGSGFLGQEAVTEFGIQSLTAEDITAEVKAGTKYVPGVSEEPSDDDAAAKKRLAIALGVGIGGGAFLLALVVAIVVIVRKRSSGAVAPQ